MSSPSRKNLQDRKRRRDNLYLKSKILRQFGLRIHPLNNDMVEAGWEVMQEELKRRKNDNRPSNR